MPSASTNFDQFLRISLFGGIKIEQQGQELTDFASRKADALVAYLARNPGMHQRERLATMLWDDRPQERALGNLRVVLTSLRKQLQSHITITRQTAGLTGDSGIWIDVAVFEGLVREVFSRSPEPGSLTPKDLEQLEQALDLAGEEFLAGFGIRDAADFEEWIIYERERIQHLMVQALTLLTEHYLETQELRLGILWAQRMTEVEPLYERGHQLLMLLLHADGKRSAALAQYETLVAVLNEELGITPSIETQRIVERIVQGDDGPVSLEAVKVQAVVANVARSQPPSLPVQLTPFIGRGEERQDILERLLLPGCRLLTVVGPGGIGKTRLSLAVAQRIQDEHPDAFSDGIFFVPLERVSQPAYISSAIADALGIALTEAARTDLQIINYLRHKRTLLVADNFEHLLDGADLILAILQAAPGVKVLVTSRERLNFHGEWLVELQGLPCPIDMGAPLTVEDAIRFPALQLFTQDAQAVQPSFRLGEELDAAVGICRWLGGMPLGIQLAAASARAFSCSDILNSIRDNLDFLRTDMRNIPDRHRSLRAVFEHSWALLNEAEQRALRQLSVFVGSFSAEAAEYVAGVTPNVLRSLVNRSLIEAISFVDTDEHQYKIHAVLRQYALAKLTDVLTEEKGTRDRHAVFFVEMLNELEASLRGNEATHALVTIARDLENIREAWSWSVETLRLDQLERALHSFAHYYMLRGPFQEGRMAVSGAELQLRSALNGNAEPRSRFERLLSRVLVAAASLCNRMASYDEALELAREAVLLAAAAEAAEAEAEGYLQAALALRYKGDFVAALSNTSRALDLARQHEMKTVEGESLATLGTVSLYQGAYEEARTHLNEALTVYRATSRRREEARALNGLGVLYLYQGQYSEARVQYEQSLDAYREIGDRHGEGQELNNLGAVAHHLGEFEEALRHYEQALLLREQLAEYQGVGLTSGNLGLLAHHMGNHETALTYCQVALRIAHERGDRDSEAFALLGLSQAQLSLDRVPDAIKSVDQAIELRTLLEQPNQLLEAQSWRMRAELLHPDGKADANTALEMLAALQDNSLIGIVDPFAVYWTCYQVLLLADHNDAERALTQGYALLRARADRIRGSAMRHIYFHSWPSRRQIAEAYMSAGGE